MNRFLTRAQIKAITLLNGVIAVLILGIIVTNSIKADVPLSAEPYRHEIIRTARVSAHENIAWEINLGGSGNDNVISSHKTADGYAFFYTTTSTDLDCVSGGKSYAVKLNFYGTVTANVPFDFSIVKAVKTVGGWAVIGNRNDEVILALIDETFVVKSSVTLNDFDLTAVDLFVFNGRLLAVTVYTHPLTNKNAFIVYSLDGELNVVFSRVISRAFDLKYVNLIPLGNEKFLLATNTVDAQQNFLTVAEFSNKTESAFYDFGIVSYSYSTVAFYPSDNGFVALIVGGGKSDFLLIDKSLNATGKTFVSNSQEVYAKYSNGFAYVTSGENTYKFGSSFVDKTIVSDVYAPLYDVTSNNLYTVVSSGGINLSVFSNVTSDVKKITVASELQQLCSVITNDDGFIIVCSSQATCDDVKNHFGGIDVWIAKILL